MYTSLFQNCNGYWDFRNNLLPIIGTLTGTLTGTTLANDKFGVSNKAYLLNGSSDKITIGNIAVSIKSLIFRIKLANTTTSILKLTDTPHKITVSNGVLTITGWPTTVATFVDGIASSTLNDTNWHTIAIATTGTAFVASNLIVGYDGTTYLNGTIGELLTFSTQLSAADILMFYKLMNQKPLYPIVAGYRELS